MTSYARPFGQRANIGPILLSLKVRFHEVSKVSWNESVTFSLQNISNVDRTNKFTNVFCQV